MSGDSASRPTSPDDGAAADNAIATERLELNPQQLEKIISAIQRPPEPAVSLDRIAKLLEVIGLVAAAFWAVYGYYSFRRENESLQLRQQEMSLRLSEMDAEHKRLDIALGRQDAVLKELDIEYSKGRQLEISRRLDVRPQAPELYLADFAFGVSNKSKSPAEVSIVVIRHFRASQPTKISGEASLFEFNGILEDGILDWKEMGHQAYVYAPLSESTKSIDVPYMGQTKTFKLDRPGGPTGLIAHGEKVRFSSTYLVKGRRGDWVGFLVHVFINWNKPDRWYHWLAPTAALSQRRQADAPKEATE